jgi:putative methyltransferase
MPTVYYILRTAYDLTGQHPDSLTWQPPYFFENSADLMYSDFEKDQPNVVCISMYVWNHRQLAAFAKKIKQNYPDTIIIAGGPESNWRQYQQFMTDYPHYDYIVYGDGEESFIRLIDLLAVNKARTIDLLNIPNLMFRDQQNKLYQTPHQVYRGNLFTDYSSLIHCQEEFVRDCATVRSRGARVNISYETDRGCPYKCSFCDWSAGLHNKVIKKKYNPNDEIYLLAEQGCLVLISNANFGIYDQDFETARLFWSLQASGLYPGFELNSPSWAKLNKDRVIAFFRLQAEITGTLRTKIALQSISPEVLENIDRPSIEWPKFKKILLDLVNEISNPVAYELEIIAGLPGESADSWTWMLYEFIDLPTPINGQSSGAAFWYMLPNSPGADPEYIKTHQCLFLDDKLAP